MQTNKPLDSKATQPAQSTGKLRWLFESRATIGEPYRRRARLLTALLLSLILLISITLLIVLLDNPASSPRRIEYIALIIVMAGLLVVAYRLNETGHYRASARLTVALAVLGPWCSLVIDPVILRGDFVPMAYVALSILLCSILLSVRTTIALALLQLVGLWLLSIFVPATAAINWASLLTFIFFSAVFNVVANVISRQDMDQIDVQAQQLREQSILDPLTGLYNRLYLDETLKRELYRMARSQHQLGLIMLDADNFKEVNDSLGHGVGDVFLREWGAFLKERIRKEDIACRYGGDEFLLILPDVTREAVLARAENLRDAVKWLQVQREGRVFGPVTFSLGVAIYPEHGTTSDALLRAVDAALYRAKRDGRDCVRVAD